MSNASYPLGDPPGEEPITPPNVMDLPTRNTRMKPPIPEIEINAKIDMMQPFTEEEFRKLCQENPRLFLTLNSINDQVLGLNKQIAELKKARAFFTQTLLGLLNANNGRLVVERLATAAIKLGDTFTVETDQLGNKIISKQFRLIKGKSEGKP